MAVIAFCFGGSDLCLWNGERQMLCRLTFNMQFMNGDFQILDRGTKYFALLSLGLLNYATDSDHAFVWQMTYPVDHVL